MKSFILGMTTVLSIIIITWIFLSWTNSSNEPKTLFNSACSTKGVFPDKACTPGSLNSAVFQEDIDDTICKSGWTSIVRPAENITEPQKFKSMRMYGDSTSKGQAGKYEYDHFIPLELGGAVNDPNNFWPEPHIAKIKGFNYGSYTKDKVENALRRAVCSRIITLAEAQSFIIINWTQALGMIKNNYIPQLPTQ